jgi:hypothetical protein
VRRADLPDATRRRRLWALLAAAVVAILAVGAVVVLGSRDEQPAPQDRPIGAPSGAPDLGPAVGGMYAVSPDGDDDDEGSARRPWRTLEHALAQLRPGDRLVVGEGRYEENVRLDVREGRPEAPIQVVAEEGARPVLVGLLWLEDLSWWDIRGLNVTWDDGNDADQHMVKLTDGVGWRFADAEVWGAKSFAAILVDGEPEDFTLSGLYVHDTHPANDTNQDHLIYLNCGTGGGVLERSILAHSANGRAVKIGPPDKGKGEVSDIVIRYVTMVDNRGPSNVQLAYEVSRVVVEHSILVGSAEGRANVTAFDLEGEGNVVRDSLGWESSGVLDEGITDGGGIVELDPRLSGADSDRPFFPAAEEAQAYGRWAPEP